MLVLWTCHNGIARFSITVFYLLLFFTFKLEATSLMLTRMSIESHAYSFELSWRTPTVFPLHYTMSVKCRYICSNEPYSERSVGIPYYEKSTVVKCLQPGSSCQIHIFAIYNYASIDQGKHFEVRTSITGSIICTNCVAIIYLYYIPLAYSLWIFTTQLSRPEEHLLLIDLRYKSGSWQKSTNHLLND